MDLATTTLIFLSLILVALLLEPLSRRIYLGFGATLIAAGFIGSEIITGMGIDTGLRWYHFSDIALNLLLPILLFVVAFNLKLKPFLKYLPLILLLAIPFTIVSIAINSGIMYYSIGGDFTWLAALIGAILLTASDSSSATTELKHINAQPRVIYTLEGEGFFNDAAAIALFSLSMLLLEIPETSLSGSFLIRELFYLLATSIGCGIFIGGVAWLLSKWLTKPVQRSLLSLIAGFFSFVIADKLLVSSGAISILVTGMIIGHVYRNHQESHQHVQLIWNFMRYIAESLLFILMGVTITWALFTEQWAALLIGAAAALISRSLVIHALVPASSLIPKVESFNYQQRNLMLWGHLRGGVTLALALSLPENLDHWWTVQALAYGAVIFALFIQAPTLRLLNKESGQQ